MKAKKIRALVAAEVERVMALSRESGTYSTLTIHFDNKAVSIPYEPWQPRSDVTLPGRWVNGEDDTGLSPEMETVFDKSFPGWRDHFPYSGKPRV